jgi:hypothetical protein
MKTWDDSNNLLIPQSNYKEGSAPKRLSERVFGRSYIGEFDPGSG